MVNASISDSWRPQPSPEPVQTTQDPEMTSEMMAEWSESPELGRLSGISAARPSSRSPVAMDSYQRPATLSPNGLLNAHRAQSSNSRSGTASPPIHVSPVTSVRLRDLAARLQQTVNDQRRYRATTTNDEPVRMEERKIEDGEEADCDADFTTRTGLSTSHTCSLSTRHLPGGNLKDLEKLARGLLDENGDKIVRRRHQTFPHRPGR